MGDRRHHLPAPVHGVRAALRRADHQGPWPDAWEAIFGTILAPGESRENDRRTFEVEHAGDWIVVSAITSDQENGFVECVATPSGKCDAGAEERRFLVSAGEYQVGRFGFVIDLDRHAVYAVELHRLAGRRSP